jgi:hypothetical protein
LANLWHLGGCRFFIRAMKLSRQQWVQLSLIAAAVDHSACSLAFMSSPHADLLRAAVWNLPAPHDRCLDADHLVSYPTLSGDLAVLARACGRAAFRHRIRFGFLGDWLPIHRPEDRAIFVKGLRKAGLPDERRQMPQFQSPNGNLRQRSHLTWEAPSKRGPRV